MSFTPASKQHGLPRRAGILLHPTSLPSRHGIGDLGPAATRFLDFLAECGAKLWQTLPLGPVGYGNSPYAARSAFAGNPLLISLELIHDDGLLTDEELSSLPVQESGLTDFDTASRYKLSALRTAHERLQSSRHRDDFLEFRQREAGWLDDWTLYAAASDAFGKRAWTNWEPTIARRAPSAIDRWNRALEGEIDFQRFLQWAFFRQWDRLRALARERDIQIVGDLPIFVAHDSADVWSRPELFQLDGAGNPTVVAGVPPDYFSETGQRWGNPLYRWDVLDSLGYEWWRDRIAMSLRLFDLLRIDHFRGFQACWEIPATEETAINGRWASGPGKVLFESLERSLGRLPILVEDLGIITPEVGALRDELGYPGMKVLQFAFDSGPDNPFLPYSYHSNTVVYTGTHDNDTTRAWYAQAPEHTRDAVRRYCARAGDDVAWDFIRLALASVSDTAIVPLQDVLNLGGSARMNCPGTADGNWSWRYQPDDLQPSTAERFHGLVEIYGRLPELRQKAREE